MKQDMIVILDLGSHEKCLLSFASTIAKGILGL